MATLTQDLHFALRLLKKNPGFTFVVIVVLALGIGANTAIFSIFNATLLRGLPYPEPERLARIYMSKQGTFGQFEASYPAFRDWQAQATTFESIAAYSQQGSVFRSHEGAQPVDSVVVSENFFSTLGIVPALGSIVFPDPFKPGSAPTVVITHSAWERRFGKRQDIVGLNVSLNNTGYTVIGVLPRDFHFAPILPTTEFFGTFPTTGPIITRRNLHWLQVVGRLKDGASLAQGTAEMETIAAQLANAYPESLKDITTRTVPLRETIVGEVRPVLIVLLSAVGFVLLIACANLANVLLARSVARQRELAVRVALGARRFRIIRQMLTESLVLALLGGTAGLVLGYWALRLLKSTAPPALITQIPSLQFATLDLSVFSFAMGAAVLSGLLVGFAPAWQAAGADPNDALKTGTSAARGSGRHLFARALIGVELALSIVLLVGAGLVLKSLMVMLNSDPGFRTDNLLTVAVLPTNTDQAKNLEIQRELFSRVRRLPGVEDVAHANIVPLNGGNNTVRYVGEGQDMKSAGEQYEANIRTVTANYFKVIGATLVAGRPFNDGDSANTPPIIIVNRALAEQLFPGENPIGKRLKFTFAPDQPWREIVGLIENVNEVALDVKARPAMYAPYTQGPGRLQRLVIRTKSNPSHLANPVRAEALAMDPGAVIFATTTMDEIIGNSRSTVLRRYPAILVSVLATVALILAVVGIYGVISYAVTQRTQEIGIRMALGASRGDVLRMIYRSNLPVFAAGVGLGVLGAAGSARLIAGLLFGVSPADPAIYAGATALLVGTALVAIYLPARRASRVDPMVALREQ